MSKSAPNGRAVVVALRPGEPVQIFRGRRLPVPAHLAGYSALIDRFNLRVPLPHDLAAVSPKAVRRKGEGWVIFPAALRPGDDVVDHLVFALKHEGVQLLTLKHSFLSMDKAELERAARKKPTSAYLRRLCFFFEWLTDGTLDIPDTAAGVYVDAIDPKFQYHAKYSYQERRFRVRHNLPGSPLFCPLVFKTHAIDRFMESDLSGRAKEIVASAPKELIARAAAFLLLSDSKASFAIEGEHPPKDRIARWGNVIGKAGRLEISPEQLVSLQRELIGDDRFVHIGLRTEGGFVGRHDSSGEPEPEHISANARDLEDLLEGIFLFDYVAKDLSFDAVLTAACISFGFVYVHPFEDGNGRIHRFLMHHVLADREFTPPEIVFPISSVILDDIARYKDVLERVSRPLLDIIKWKPTDKGNIQVLMETADYYRFFDATAHCEYLFRCLERAVEKDLPEELQFLERRDEFHRRATHIVDMSERTLDLLLRFLRQGHGSLSKRARENEFAKLRPQEVREIEQTYAELFQ